MIEAINGLRQIRRRHRGVTSPSAPRRSPTARSSLQIEQHASSNCLQKKRGRCFSVSLIISSYPIKYFAAALVILAANLHVHNLIKLTRNVKDENISLVRRMIALSPDGSSSLRGALVSKNIRFPRIVALSQGEPTNLTDMRYYTIHNDVGQNNTLSSDDDPPLVTPELLDGYNLEECKPMHDWQHKSFPSCNMMHENNLSEMTFLTTGTLRSVLELSESIDGKVDKFVYKNLDFEGKYGVDVKRINQERKDALILERTTKSQFIPSIHGYCGTAVIMDHAPRDLEYFNDERLERNITISPLERLKISIHIASGVADLHSVDFMHNDLHEQQFLYQDGLFKLNDFNYAKPMYIDKNTSETCSMSKFNMGMYGRSLEELQLKVDNERFTPVKPDKVDVWMMGNLLYTILTDLYVWDWELRSDKDVKLETAKRLVNGERPPIPDLIQKSNDPAHVAMKNALDMTWKFDSKERPAARSIANYLIGELKTITGEETPDFKIKFLNEDS